MAPSDILSLNVHNSSLDLLNAAIVSNHHQVGNDNRNLGENDLLDTKETQAHGKRIHDTEELNVTAPKRAGRKPLDESKTQESINKDPKQKRKAQNRAAQRAFRERKEKHVSELQARIDELERLNETKDEALIKENEQLKEMLRQLREENYALKGAQFTFEYPLSENNNHLHTVSPFTPSSSSASPTEQYNPYSSMSHMSSSNSYTGEDASSSSEQSPLTNEDDSPSIDTPAVSFSTDLLQFGLIPSAHDANTTPATTNDKHNNTTGNESSLNLFAPTNSISNNNNNNNNNNYNNISNNNISNNNNNNINISNNNNNNNNNNYNNISNNSNSAVTDQLPAGDLFHGKDDLFSNYREPISIGDDFLFANEDLSNLFASDGDFFGLNYDSSSGANLFSPSAPGVNDLFSLNAQFGLPEPPMSRMKPISFEKKLEMYERVKKAKEEGKRVYELHQELKQEIPEFDLDSLCDDLRNKAQCSLSPYKVTANEVDAFVKCLDRV